MSLNHSWQIQCDVRAGLCWVLNEACQGVQRGVLQYVRYAKLNTQILINFTHKMSGKQRVSEK
jgi:hypothetical protein